MKNFVIVANDAYVYVFSRQYGYKEFKNVKIGYTSYDDSRKTKNYRAMYGIKDNFVSISEFKAYNNTSGVYRIWSSVYNPEKAKEAIATEVIRDYLNKIKQLQEDINVYESFISKMERRDF